MNLKSYIRSIENYPKEGITFMDISTLLKDAEAFKYAIDQLIEPYKNNQYDAVIGIEARGFLFASAIANQLGVGMVPIRKIGKLPWDTYQEKFDLEYGSSTIEIHQDALKNCNRVLLVDDVLATGGTANGALKLIERFNVSQIDLAFLINLKFLQKKNQLNIAYKLHSVINYE